MSLRIIEARDEHMPAVLDIYNYEVLHGVATFDTEPRLLEAQMEWLREHAHPYTAIVAQDGGRVVGFGSLSRYHSRPAYDFTVEDTVYVHQDLRRRGIGRDILEALVEIGRKHGYHTMLARITAENTPSVELHARCGFVDAGCERQVGRKFGRWLDVITMQLMLD